MDLPNRNGVLVIGTASFDRSEFLRRDLALKDVTVESARDYLNYARAILVAEHPGRFAFIKYCYSELFPIAEDFGVAPVVIVHSQADQRQVDAIQKIDFPESHARISLIQEIWRAAEDIARYRPGLSAGDVSIESTEPIPEREHRLLSRAFGDCKRIYLESLSGGNASIFVFRVHAWFNRSIVGPRPLPFFAKIATCEEVENEKIKYRDYVDDYIPFNLRPQLDHERCVHGRTHAALVGTFVDDAIPLRTALRLGQGIGVLFSLFETSLRGLRAQPLAAGEKRRENVLAAFVADRIAVNRLLQSAPERIGRAQSFGLSLAPESIQDILCQTAAKIACLVGPSHRDLHPGNVMIRNGDAILIDFSSAGDGPLTADPAALESTLIFGTDKDDDPCSFIEWRKFVDEVYGEKVTTLHPSELYESQPGRFSWLRRSLRELRHVLLGCDCEPNEAKIILASYLMRFARLPVESLPNTDLCELAERRHAYALVIAERIAKSLDVFGGCQ